MGVKQLKSVMRDLFRGDMPITVPNDKARELFRLLAEEVNDLFDGIEVLRESLWYSERIKKSIEGSSMQTATMISISFPSAVGQPR